MFEEKHPIICQKIRWQDTLPLRQSVLRPGLPPEQSHFPGDDDEGTFHLGAVNSSTQIVVGIGSFRRDALPAQPALLAPDGSALSDEILKALKPYRLRGMAVHPDFRRQGIGDRILQAGEAELRHLGCEILWFNARIDAFKFYHSNGYEFASELFSINGVGPHKVMLKKF